MQQRLQIQLLLWNILRAVRHKVDRGPYMCRRQVMLMTTYNFFCVRCIGEVLDWYRGEDAGVLKRSELNDLVEKLTCLNALEGKIGKVFRKS